MTSLNVRSFRTFFKAIHGVDPFPWQRRLVERLHETGLWPEALDLPTGTGKTAAIDAAVFHLALEAGKPERRAPMRVLYVVDRRTIVDQAHDRAVRIQQALSNSTEPVMVAVRERLASLSREGVPLAVAILRGGIARDDGWARTPDQPLVAVSTVDQVGSRLLFRGYGVSDSMRPVHAGLLANDSLLLLDEVHLSNPFVESLEQIDGRYMRWAEEPLPRRWQWVPMSATPRTSRKDALGLDAEDEAHPVLRRRLSASRPARLREVAARGEGELAQRALVGALCEEALEMARGGRAVAVVVNRVATARAVFVILHQRLAVAAEVFLLTGRMRPVEREALEDRIRPMVGAGLRSRQPDARPVVVVATQCIEAGADLDFDGLVTECASLDAIRQRFGRLNRLGDIEDAEGVVVVRKDVLKAEDPIYGPALANTWSYLSRLPEVDFGLGRFRMPPRKDLPELLPPLEHAPVLLPAHLDLWVQTAPVPAVDPDLALWLHGPERGQPEVQIVWRADVSAEMLRAGGDHESVLQRLEACPPSTPEALAVPLPAARRWLAGSGEAAISDVDGMQAGDDRAPTQRVRRAFAWRGDASGVVEWGDVRPGDTLVVPADYGGLLHGSWAPESETPVVDLGDRAYALRRGKAILRLHAAVLGGHARSEVDGALPGWAASPPVPAPEGEEANLDAIRDWLDGVIAASTAPEWMKEAAAALRRDLQTRRPPRIINARDARALDDYVTLVGRVPLRNETRSEGGTTTEDDTGSFTGTESTLREHLRGVGDIAREYARNSGLPEERVDDLALAGALHDVGKADRRFQAMLRGGSVYAAEVAAEPLAKSSIPAADRATRESARVRAGYPRGARHELVSLALLGSSEEVRKRAKDFELVQHLVASHHGHCRPFAPFAEDEDPVEVAFTDGALDLRASSAHGFEAFGSGVSDRFWGLVRKYGWFGLAWLEAILRLADHRRSELEQRGAKEAS